MSRPKMFVPSHFTVEDGTVIKFEQCQIIKDESWNSDSYNLFKTHFKGNIVLTGWDIYTEDHPVVFMDKLESYITKEERLV